MRQRLCPVVGATATVAVLAVAAVLLGAAATQAAPAGTLSVEPHQGTDTTAITLHSSGLCPGTATNLIVTLNGTGFNNAVAVGNTALTAFQQINGGYVVPLSGTMRDLANQQSPVVTTLSGRYDFTLTCRTAFNPTSLGDFIGSLWFTSNTAYQDTDPGNPTTTPPTTTAPTTTAPTPTDTATTGTPTDTSTTDFPTDTTPAPTDTTTTAAQGAGDNAGEGLTTTIGGGRRLARTGVAVWPQLLLAEVLIFAGAALTLAARRRPARAGRHR